MPETWPGGIDSLRRSLYSSIIEKQYSSSRKEIEKPTLLSKSMMIVIVS